MGEKFDLGAYLKQAVPDSGTMPRQIETIDIGLIDSDERNFYELSGVEALAANIQLCGLQQPLLVRPSPADSNRVVIVSGHRRRAALELLAKDDSKWRQVEVIRETAPGSEALQELKLIFANNDTRRMTDADLAQQAQRVQELLYQLKEQEGVEFPGRMRDHVAEACQVNKTKLSMLKVIQDNLDAKLLVSWKLEQLPTQSAYNIARMPIAAQAVFAAKKSHNFSTNATAQVLENMPAYLESSMSCKDGSPCSNGLNFLRHDAGERYSYQHCEGRQCCIACYRAASCSQACSRAKDAAAERRAKEAAEKEARESEAETRRVNGQAEAAVYWSRIQGLCERKGITLDDLFQDVKELSVDGSTKIYVDRILNQERVGYYYHGMVRVNHLKTVAAIADYLECSADEVVGLPCRFRVGVDLAESKPQWRTDDPPEGARVLGKFDVGEGLRPTLSVVYFHNGLYWLDKNWSLDYDLPLLGWSPIPED